MNLDKDFVQWYLSSLRLHSVDSIVIHEERIGGNLRKFMICNRCMWIKDIPNYLIESYEKACSEREEFLNGR